MHQPGFDTILAEMATLAIEHLESDGTYSPRSTAPPSAAHALCCSTRRTARSTRSTTSASSCVRLVSALPDCADVWRHVCHLRHILRHAQLVNGYLDELFATNGREIAQVVAAYDDGARAEAAHAGRRLHCRVQRARARHWRRRHGVQLLRADHKLSTTLVSSTLHDSGSCPTRALRESSRIVPTGAGRRAGAAVQVTAIGATTSALRQSFDVERSALVELLSLLKGLHATLHAVCGDNHVLVLRGIHEQADLRAWDDGWADAQGGQVREEAAEGGAPADATWPPTGRATRPR